MATKSGQQEPETAEIIEELLDALDAALDRVKVLYEQYFLGIQKQPPSYLHTDVERKLRDLAQIQIRNTALRYRFATLQQKYGSYNSYWRRTLRQIENGTYTRNLFKIGRQAARTGAEVPEEILAAMPKRMRDQVVRDREAALALAALRERQARDGDIPTLADEDVEVDLGDLAADDTGDLPAAIVRESAEVRRGALAAGGAHRVDEADAEFDVDAFFASVIVDDNAPQLDRPSRPGTGVAPPPGAAPAPPPGSAAPRAARPAPAGTAPSQASTTPSQPSSASTAGTAPPPPGTAPSQATRPLRVMPGAAAAHPAAPVETLAGPFPRTSGPPAARPTTRSGSPAPAVPGPPPASRSAPPGRASTAVPAGQPEPPPDRRTPPPEPAAVIPQVPPRRTPAPRRAPERQDPAPRPALPPGMTDADVNALYAKYVKAKQILGEEAEPGTYGKLVKTITTQAPRILEQYKAKGVEFSVAVKDNQVIIRAKPKP